ncbi:DegT/DnrJ/EryC1/StrS family aminotransferase [Terasakiella pusilla]|uniref:DegT/DnrJ/EryC1/StrS family aminotransferase n=1 Tax=Terasakiella pusilla TaxID=64973 RepID=UPI003AA7EB6F
MKNYPVAGPWITNKEIQYAADAAANGWYETAGNYPARFEQAMAERIGRKYAISLPSCTSGLHLSLAALGLSEGDEVIVPELTWIASSAPISYVKATPIFVDCDPLTWCMDTKAFEKAITPKTKAVIVVDLYGSMPDMDAILEIANRHNIAVVEDSAEAIGSTYKGKAAGSFGLVSTFSFHGSKTLTTGEGGMLLTDDQDFYERCMVLRDHGRASTDVSFFNQEVGYKYKMSALQAALGLAQTERLDDLVARKREIFSLYEEGLKDLPLTLNAEPKNVRNSYWMSTVVLSPDLEIDKTTFAQKLAKKGVQTRPFFHPLSSIPAYSKTESAKNATKRNPIAYKVSPYGLNLPSALKLEKQDIKEIVEIIRQTIS